MLCAARGQSPGLQPAHATPTSFRQVLEDAHLHLSLPPLLSHLPWASCYPLYPVFSPIHPFPLVLVMLFNPLDKPIVKVAQLCPTLHPSPWNSPGQNAGSEMPFPSPRDLPTQGPNPGLPHCRRILYQLSYQGSPDIPINALKGWQDD